MNLDGEAIPCVEPAPDVTVAVSFNGQRQEVTLRPNSPETVQFGTFPVTVEVTTVARKKIRPAKRPPYFYVITTTCGYQREIRAMDEDNALRLFRESEGDEWQISDISAKIS